MREKDRNKGRLGERQIVGERKGERPVFERDRKKDRGGRKREAGIGEKEKERERARQVW